MVVPVGEEKSIEESEFNAVPFQEVVAERANAEALEYF